MGTIIEYYDEAIKIIKESLDRTNNEMVKAIILDAVISIKIKRNELIKEQENDRKNKTI